MKFNTKVITNCFWKPTPKFQAWASANSDWVLPINAHPDNDYVMPKLADFDQTLQPLNWTLNEIATLLAVYHKKPQAEIQYIGIQNYRRVFNQQEIDKSLQDHPDAIFARPIPLGYKGQLIRLADQYPVMHVDGDWGLFLYNMSRQPWVDLDLLQRWLNLYCLPAPCNSFIMVREVFNQFCERLEQVIVPTLKEIGLEDIAKRDAYQRRAGAFLSERFTSFYAFQMLNKGEHVKFADLELKENFAEKQVEMDSNGVIRSK